MMHTLGLVLLFIWYIPVCRAACSHGASRCDWIQWNPWGDCSRSCGGGTRYRSRSLCCPSDLAGDTSACLDYCNLQSAFSESEPCGGTCYHAPDVVYPDDCDCPDAYYGRCCENSVSCPDLTLSNGYISGSSSPYYYGETIAYNCNNGYNLTAGDSGRTCLSSGYSTYRNLGYWSGTAPRCAYAISCSSDPCQNGGTCINGLDLYTCICAHGWSGTNCEFDILPPVYDNCPADITLYTANLLGEVSWTAPIFSDPHGETVPYISLNYLQPEASLPWGEYTVQYVGTKQRNGLSTECTFTVSIYPFPCEPLIPPINGSLACNGWNSRFGEICVLFCEYNSDVPISVRMENVYVCGGSGHRASILPNGTACSEPRPRLTIARQSESRRRHYYEGHCSDAPAQQAIRQAYLDIVRDHDMSYLCDSHRFQQDCTTDNVAVYCD